MDTEYLKKVGLYILTVLLSVAALFYVGYHIWKTLTRDVETVPVTEFTAENTAESKAYIFRTEIPVFKTAGGQSILTQVSEGEKVQAGQTVAKVYSGSSPAAVAEISDIEERIELLEGSDGAVSLKESSKIEEEIYRTLAEIRDFSAKGDVQSARQLRSGLLSLLNKRALLTTGTENFKSEIEALKAQKAALSSSLSSLLEDVTSPQSGYYYSDTDGYETVFSSGDLENITYDALTELLSSQPAENPSAVGKVVTDSYWYAVCPLERKYLEVYKEGGSCTVNFPGDFVITMEVSRILSSNEGVYVILRTNDLPSGFSFTRSQKVELVTEAYTGFKVPVSAVRVVNGQTGVYILDGVTVRFARIETVKREDTYYIVSPEPRKSAEDEVQEDKEEESRYLRFHDNLITEGKGLYDGLVIG